MRLSKPINGLIQLREEVTVEGKLFGSDYVIGPKIGSGAMGTVYRAKSRTTGEVYAIKILRPEHSSDRKRLTRFINEREALGRVNHNNVVAIDDLVMEGDLFGIVMEFVDGGDLRELLHETPMTEYQIVIFAEGMAAGLEAIHSAHIVHRDLKPENILVIEHHDSFLPKVADFGIARLLDDSLTGTSGVSGTLRYMSPEVSDERFGEAGPAADMYSVGVILFELLTGEPPYTYSSPMQLLLAHAYDDIPHVSGIDPELNDLVRTMLAKDADARPTVVELRHRLAEVRARLESEVEKTEVRSIETSSVADRVVRDQASDADGQTNDDDVDVVQNGMLLVVGSKGADDEAQGEAPENEINSIDPNETVSDYEVDALQVVAPSDPASESLGSKVSNGKPPNLESAEIDLVASTSDELLAIGSDGETRGFLATTAGSVAGTTRKTVATQTAFIDDLKLNDVDQSNPLSLKHNGGQSNGEPVVEHNGNLEVDGHGEPSGEPDQLVSGIGPESNGPDDQVRQNKAGDKPAEESATSALAQQSTDYDSIPKQAAVSEGRGGANWPVIVLVLVGLFFIGSLGVLTFRLGSSNRGQVETVNTSLPDAALEIDDAGRSNTQLAEQNEGEGIGATANNTPNAPQASEDSQVEGSGGAESSENETPSENETLAENGQPLDSSSGEDGTSNSGVVSDPVAVDGSAANTQQPSPANDALTGDAAPASITAPGLVRNVVAWPGDKSANWSWTRPADDGGLPIAYYIVTSANENDVTVEVARHRMTSLANGESYGIQIKACNAERCGEESSLSIAVPAAPPAIPSSLEASVGPVSVNLTWESPEFDGGDSVKYFLVSDGGNTSRQSTSTSYSWPSPEQWPAQFRVRACNDIGCGGWTAYESVTSDAPTTLATPGGLSLSRADSAIDLRWSAVSYGGNGSVLYEVEGHGKQIQTTAQVNYRWDDLVNGFSYPFRVRACVDSECGGWTQFQNITPAGVPEQPTGLVAERTSDMIQLSWNEPTSNGAEITKYQVDQADSDPIDVRGTSIEIRDGLVADQSYSFRVRACNPICGPPTGWTEVPPG